MKSKALEINIVPSLIKIPTLKTSKRRRLSFAKICEQTIKMYMPRLIEVCFAPTEWAGYSKCVTVDPKFQNHYDNVAAQIDLINGEIEVKLQEDLWR